LIGIANFRDVGGHDAKDGRRFTTGQLYRSGHLASATDDDLATLERLGIRTVIDMRNPPDVVGDGEDRLPAGAALRRISHDQEPNGADIQQLIQCGPASEIERFFPPGTAHRFMVDVSAAWATDPGRQSQLEQIIRCVLAADGAVLIHCSAGKDRTGFAAALIQALLGVSDEAIVADYLRSNDERASHNAILLQALAQRGVPVDLLEPIFIQRPEYVLGFLGTIRAEWGGIADYVRDVLHLAGPDIEALEERLLDA
jgi:protein-tyrosine phosphatase